MVGKISVRTVGGAQCVLPLPVCLQADDKGVHASKNDKKGTLLFADGEVFDFRCACGRRHQANGPGRVRSHGTLFRSIHHHCLRTAQRPLRPVVQALSSPKSETSWYWVRTDNMSAHRLSVSFQEEPHKITCVLNRRKVWVGAVVPKMLPVARALCTTIYSLLYCCGSHRPYNI